MAYVEYLLSLDPLNPLELQSSNLTYILYSTHYLELNSQLIIN